MGCFGSLALLLPETSETDGRTEFEGLGLLLARNLNGFQKIPLGFILGVGGQGSGIRSQEIKKAASIVGARRLLFC